MRKLYSDPREDLRHYGLTSFRKQGEDDADDEDVAAARRLMDQDDEADDEDNKDDGDEDEQAKTKHLVSDLADLCVEASEGQTSRPEALRALLHTARGNALVHRLRGAQKRLQKKEQKAMTKNTTEQWHAIAKKDGGITAICKHVLDSVEKGEGTSLSEHTLTALITTAAKAAYPVMTPAAAFSKMFQEDETLRRAVQAVKTFPQTVTVTPVYVGGAAARDVNDPRGAYGQLQALAAEQRKRAPFMTPEAAFAAIYAAPENRELAELERKQARARLAATLPGMPG